MRRSIATLRRALPGAHDCPADLHESALRQRPDADSPACARLHFQCRDRGCRRPVGSRHHARRRFGRRSRAGRGHHQAGRRFLEIRAVRADAGRRRHVAQAGQPGCLFALLGQHHLRGRGHVQARQRHFPQGLGFGAVVDAGFRRAGSDLQRARLPELPSEGRARPSAGSLGRRDLDVPAAGAGCRDGRGEGGGRRPQGAELPRSGLWRTAAGPRRAGIGRRRQDGDQLHGTAR